MIGVKHKKNILLIWFYRQPDEPFTGNGIVLADIITTGRNVVFFSLSVAQESISITMNVSSC